MLSTREAGFANEGIPDNAVLEFATQKDGAVITHNRKEFIRLHRAKPDHAGIIVCTDKS